jgi:SAM-dependent methyltransferase
MPVSVSQLVLRIRNLASRLDMCGDELLLQFWRHHPRFTFFKSLPERANVADIGASEGGLVFWKSWGSPDRSDINLYGADIKRGAHADLYAGWEAVDLDDRSPSFAGVELDACYSTHLIEHLQDPQRLVRWMARRVTPGGRIYIEWPNPLTTELPTSRDLLALGIDVGPSNFFDDLTHRAAPELAEVAGALTSLGLDVAEGGVIDLGPLGEELFIRAADRAERTMGYWSMTGWSIYVVAVKGTGGRMPSRPRR